MAITGWREFPAFVGGRLGRSGRELGGGQLSASGGGAWPSRSAGAELDARWRRWPGRPRTRARPARARSGQVESANQAASNQPVGGARTRPTTTRVNVIRRSLCARQCSLLGEISAIL